MSPTNNRNCHTADRNFCAPDGKTAALFVDVDGTILVCQRYFDEANATFARYMKLRGFEPKEALEMLREVEHTNTEKVGFERDRYGRSLIEVYDKLRAKKKRRFKAEDVRFDHQICENIGRAPFFREPELFPNAAPVLGRAHHNFLIFAVTIGNREAQKYKVRQAGLNQIFDELIITSRDDKAALVAQVIKDLNIDPKLSAFIGNSLRSDGACLAVTNFVYLPLEPGAFDRAVGLPQNTGFEVFETVDWRQAEERAINSLKRRRRTLIGEEESRPRQPCHKRART
ncbi:MAG: HAD family hydrolase [Candidatus Obscuribacterales bacterium]|nr:HAD family hydrolase [Candidatus Obscuribacterales bacterium]